MVSKMQVQQYRYFKTTLNNTSYNFKTLENKINTKKTSYHAHYKLDEIS